jgi:hypothetical protein
MVIALNFSKMDSASMNRKPGASMCSSICLIIFTLKKSSTIMRESKNGIEDIDFS